MTYPTIEQFWPVEKMMPWGVETLVAETEHYTGKLLFYRAGQAGGFQYHVEKDETFYLFSGAAWVSWIHGDTVVERQMLSGESYRIPPGAPHKFRAITDCVVFEASTPHRNDRVNVSAEFGEADPPDTLPSTWHRENDGTHLRLPNA